MTSPGTARDTGSGGDLDAVAATLAGALPGLRAQSAIDELDQAGVPTSATWWRGVGDLVARRGRRRPSRVQQRWLRAHARLGECRW